MELETQAGWLPIIEYSVKTGVSLSTIRRKIKNHSIPFRLEKGKYLVQFGATPASDLNGSTASPPDPETTATRFTPLIKPTEDAVRIVTDAFEFALKEKEDRIRLLEKRNKELESNLDEMSLLIQVLEEKYEVRY